MLRCGVPLKGYLVEGDHVTCGWQGAPGAHVAHAAAHTTRLDEMACLRGFHAVLTHNYHKTIVVLSAPPPPSNLGHPSRRRAPSVAALRRPNRPAAARDDERRPYRRGRLPDARRLPQRMGGRVSRTGRRLRCRAVVGTRSRRVALGSPREVAPRSRALGSPLTTPLPRGAPDCLVGLLFITTGTMVALGTRADRPARGLRRRDPPRPEGGGVETVQLPDTLL